MFTRAIRYTAFKILFFLLETSISIRYKLVDFEDTFYRLFQESLNRRIPDQEWNITFYPCSDEELIWAGVKVDDSRYFARTVREFKHLVFKLAVRD